MGKCCSISDIFLKFQLVHHFANQLVQKQYLLVTDERMIVKISLLISGVEVMKIFCHGLKLPVWHIAMTVISQSLYLMSDHLHQEGFAFQIYEQKGLFNQLYKFGNFVIHIFRDEVEVWFKLKRNVCR